jgi:hypothetical protein
LMTAGVSLSRSDMRPKFVRFQFPSYLKQMKATSSSRATMKSILTKIGRKMHTSPRRAESYLPVFAGLYSGNPEYFESNYGFDEKEAELLKKFAPKGGRKKAQKKPGKKQDSEKHKPAEPKKQAPPPEKQEEKREESKNKELPKPTKLEHVGPKLHEFF